MINLQTIRKLKYSRSQLFAVFVLFWLGLGWLGVVLAMAGFFYKTVFIAYLAAGALALAFLAVSNLRLLRLIHPGFVSAVMLIVIALFVFSYFSSPTVFSGRDQGSLSEAAIRLSQNHELPFSFPAEKDFFEIYGPGRALNFPGFSYTEGGDLITQFPVGYIAWLAIFYSLAGLNGFILANAILFLIFLVSFYFLLRGLLSTRQSVIGIILVLTTFAFSWFFKFTLSENMALALVWFAVWAFSIFIKNQRKFYLFSALLSMGLLAFARIEALAFLFMMVLLVLIFADRRKKDPLNLVGKEVVWISAGIGILFAASVYVNRQFYLTLGKAAVSPAPGATGVVFAANIFSSLAHTIKVFYAYDIFIFLVLGALGVFYFYRNNAQAVVPFLIIVPSFLYVFFPNISSDHPWMLRRYVFAVIPAAIFYSLIFIDAFFAKKRVFYLIAALLIVFNLQVFIKYLPVIPHKRLLAETEIISGNFKENDLVLVDREASGDGWSMITGPMNSLFGRQAVYFFNPEDLGKIDEGKYAGVYFIVPDSRLPVYEEWGLSERLNPVRGYEINNNFLESEAAGEGKLYPDSVTLPREKSLTVSGKIYKLQ